MKKVILIIILFFEINYTMAQGQEDLIDNSWENLQQCFENNNIDMFNNEKQMFNQQTFKEVNNANDILKIVGANYKDDIKEIIEFAITKASSKLPAIKKNVQDVWEISSHLEHLFFGYFNEKYASFFQLDPCREIDKDKVYLDYYKLLESTVNVVEEQLKSYCCSSDKCLGYSAQDYFFRIAVLMYKPELHEYIEGHVLIKKSKMRRNETESQKNLNYLWKILEDISM